MLYALMWWAVMLVLGLSCLPFTNYIFRRFRDGGWIFSKTIGLFLAAWATWVLNTAGVIPFRQEWILAVTGGLCLINYGIYFYLKFWSGYEDEEEEPAAEGTGSVPGLAFLSDRGSRRLILFEELLFLALILGWMWIVGFNPEAYGTEKFMDYGFLTAMARSSRIPFEDTWYAGKTVNYYYGGQYITAWLMKGTGILPGIAYNVMRSLVTAFSFMLPFSLVYQLMYDRVNAAAGRRFGRMKIFSVKPEGLLNDVPAEMMDPEEGGILKSVKEARRIRRKHGLAEVRKKRAREAAYKAERFLADTEDETVPASVLDGTDEDGEDRSEREGRSRSERRGARGKRRSRRIRMQQRNAGRNMRDPAAPASMLAGLLAGMGTAFCGTMHYVVYGLVKPLTDEGFLYWFPDATRYIGYDPDLPDKTIHEFPAYSSILGDLHAHYLNILFVVTVTAVIYAWAQKQERGGARKFAAFRPELLLAGLMTGVFRWTNFWDFPIYYVVCGAVVFFVNLRLYSGEPFRFVRTTVLQAAVIFGAGYAGALPFTLNFDMISSAIGRTHSHTLPHQLLIVWGLPVLILLLYAVTLFREQRHMRKTTRRILWKAHRIALPDLTVLLFGLCAAGLVMIPEVIYVIDIYGGDHYRANTMFKLTYQAFILFAAVTAYALVRVLVVNSFRTFEAEFREETKQDVVLADMLASADLAAQSALRESESTPISEEENVELALQETETEDRGTGAYDAVKEMHRKKSLGRRLRIGAAAAGIALQCVLAGYTATGVISWFGNVTAAEKRISDDAAVFIERRFPGDRKGIRWLNRHVEGQPVILEAAGDSYSDCGRVSVSTGLPTVAGWYVHEWLWRGDREDLDKRTKAVKTIYTSKNPEKVRELIDKYKITYIYIGELERKQYGDVQDALLQKMGTVAWSDGVSAYIMKVR